MAVAVIGDAIINSRSSQQQLDFVVSAEMEILKVLLAVYALRYTKVI